MTKEELKKEAIQYAVDYPTRYGKGYKRKDLRIAYLAGAEPREKRIAELEHKLEQTEKDLADYQFNYPTIKELEKENAELEKKLTEKVTLESLDVVSSKISELEKENAELKKNYEDSLVACGVLKAKVDTLAQPSPLESMQDVLITAQKVANEKQKEQLTKAKELLAKWVELFKPKGGNIPPTPIQEQTEQFLKDSDIDGAIKQANEGLDFNKIADEMKQDLKDSEVEK